MVYTQVKSFFFAYVARKGLFPGRFSSILSKDNKGDSHG